ncbi:hypothetical protein THAOC_28724, partial [Thalassiosira oceanica]
DARRAHRAPVPPAGRSGRTAHQFRKGGRGMHSEPVVLRKKFSWRNYPELEEYLNLAPAGVPPPLGAQLHGRAEALQQPPHGGPTRARGAAQLRLRRELLQLRRGPGQDPVLLQELRAEQQEEGRRRGRLPEEGKEGGRGGCGQGGGMRGGRDVRDVRVRHAIDRAAKRLGFEVFAPAFFSRVVKHLQRTANHTSLFRLDASTELTSSNFPAVEVRHFRFSTRVLRGHLPTATYLPN